MRACAQSMVRAALALLLCWSPAVGWAAAEDAGPDPMLFDIDLAICTLIVFLLTLGVLRKFAWGPIVTGLERREQAIADNIATAENAAEEARKLTAHYEEKLAGAADEVRAIIEEARRDAEHVGQQIVDKAQAKAAEEGERLIREVEQAKHTALREISDRGADLVISLAGKIVAKELNTEDHAALIRNDLAKFSEAVPSDN